MIRSDKVTLNERAGGTSARPANLDAVAPDSNQIASGRGSASDSVVRSLNIDTKASFIPRAPLNCPAAGISADKIARY